MSGAPAHPVPGQRVARPAVILLNGIPGSGKSTLARRYAGDHPLTLALDIDVVRSLVGGWENDPRAAGLTARRLALEMVKAHVRAGFDVVVPQLLARPTFVEALADTAGRASVPFIETVLDVPVTVASARCEARGTGSDDVIPAVAAHALDPDGRWTVEALEGWASRLESLLRTRPRAVRVSASGDEHSTYAGWLAVVRRERGRLPQPVVPGGTAE